MSNGSKQNELGQLGELYTWEKDKHFRYIKCNENYARAAGLDSPASIVGKSDDQMPWRSLADYFRVGDQTVIDGKGPSRVLIQEKEIMVDRGADILVTEKQLVTNGDKCIGVIGYFVDITGYDLVRRSDGLYSVDKKRLYLGEEFGGQYLTRTEARVLEKVISGWTSRRIAETFHNSQRTIENHVETLKRKLNCDSKADLVSLAQSKGLHWTLLDCQSKFAPRSK
jgi:DNA-binding CsgD family transcriptional regulator